MENDVFRKRKKAIFVSNYYEINGGENGNCPVSSPISICQNSSNERCKIASALPGGDISCSRDISFMKLLGKIGNEICRNAIVRQTFTALIACDSYYIKMQSTKKNYYFLSTREMKKTYLR